MNIIVIANCHVQPIREGLALSSEVDETFSVPIHLINTVHYFEAIEKIKNASKKRFIVLQFNGLLEKAALGDEIMSRVDRVLSFTNIHFSGLHPDITYLGGMGSRVVSALGDYHSKICLLAFKKGYSIDQCEKLFNHSTYHRLDFYNEWNVSERELLNRDTLLDIKFAQEFLIMSRSENTLYTFNHPLGFVFHRFLEKIYQALDIQFPKFPNSFFYNFLANDVWWPVYPEISEFHQSTKSMSMSFKAPDHLGGKLYNLNQFISSCYRLYDQQAIHSLDLPENISKKLETF